MASLPRIHVYALLLVLTFTACPTLLTAQNEPIKAQTEPLISAITLEQFQTMVQAMGFECSRSTTKDGKPDNFFSFRAEGYKVIGFVETPDAGLLYASFTDLKLPIEFFNNWNLQNRYSRTYRDEDGNASIEADIIVSHGVTRENIEAQIKEFRDSVVRFVRLGLDRQAEKAKTTETKTAEGQKQ